ncbi:hypothetical protein Y032_0063g3478 [Ancylostoma ceylanicum]|uniref:G-protein coupled receptors family 1 profile domain-containing protein n=2 Tax=Ancylostoma ceylanicum TaxID=53326 RepID=A0A016U223_9BILA|nr:hypothetical protein Y032_0063g3478 [Ancylostoma ceylanicum]
MWLYQASVEVLQFLMNIFANICGCGIHSYIAIRIIANYDKMTQYKGFIVAQSTIFFIDATICLLLNYVHAGDNIYYGLPFLPLSFDVFTTLGSIYEVVLQIEAALLSIFNVYRTCVIVRPRFKYMYYIIAISINVVSYALSRMFMIFLKLEYQIASVAISATSALPTIICYVVIQRFFRDINSSDHVKKMQSKLSLGLLMQVALFEMPSY